MKLPLYIAWKSSMHKNKDGSGTKPIMFIAMCSIGLSIAVMLIALAVVTGFQKEIKEKVVGFSGHIKVRALQDNNYSDVVPIFFDTTELLQIQNIEGVYNASPYALKEGVIKTSDQVHGVILKGVDAHYPWLKFQPHLVKGRHPAIETAQKSNEVIISQYLALKLKLKLGDKLDLFFVQKPLRRRKFTIVGLYETGLEKFDQNHIIGDLRHIQKINEWDNQVAGLEVHISNMDQLEEIKEKINTTLAYDKIAQSITQEHPDIFGWLSLLDVNVIVILVFALLVGGINMITGLLIIIVERIPFIGILKTLGATNRQIFQVFLIKGLFLVIGGMIAGNIIAVFLCFGQLEYAWIKLAKETYYLSSVPINWSWTNSLLTNILTLFSCLLMLCLPALYVAKINPAKSIRFE